MNNFPLSISGEDIWKKLEAASSSSQKVCFIFGAGASYGHIPYAQYQAPIVRDLFNMSNPAVSEVLARPEHEILKNNIPHYERQLRRHNNDLEAYLSAQY